MPLNLATGATLAQSTDFQARVAMAFYYIARQVFTEDPKIDGHEVRLNFARSIILQPWSEFTKYTAMVATDPTIVENGPYQKSPPLDTTLDQSKVTDDRIRAAVTSMWSSLAGVQPTAAK